MAPGAVETGAVTSQIFPSDVQQTLDLVGIFVFALSGGLLAVRKNMDIFGICVLAEVTALGGGVMRDLVIGATPVAAFSNLGYFSTPLAAGLVVFFLHPQVERINRSVQTLDALGLGLFCVTGTAKAHDYGLGSVASVALGMVTAAGGGVMRDVLAQEIPSLLRWDREIYAVPALIGSATTAVLIAVDHLTAATGTTAALTAFLLRMFALKFGWRAPRAWHRNGSRTSEE
ncbi:trimeric intracellular cation channel family protein [Kitasatospora herbaricolor]|uniref:Trimeric intracellular cation channel family protein n=1 Tax=Kitasatospora herbaricolor TaxID=68217 RepID=A0ABZ1W7E6_9ACTN|nr:trimeric intracellular cation channel family protein [Kitasatospora herbaricolor]